MAGKRLYLCKVAKGPRAGATYGVVSRTNWGQRQVSVDPATTGWHASPSKARAAAEAAGWGWVLDKAGELTLVHSSVFYLYRPAPPVPAGVAA